MSLALLLCLSSALDVRPDATPLRKAPERTGIRLDRANTLKLETAAGILVDSNPTNTPIAEYQRAIRKRLRVATPGIGTFVAPAAAWKLERHKYSVALRGVGRLWSLGYLAPDQTLPFGLRGPATPGRYWLQGQLGVDGLADGTFQWKLGSNARLTSGLTLMRTTAPTPELLGAVQGHTTVGLTQGFEQSNAHRTWNYGLQVGVNGDVLDGLTLDLRQWRAPNLRETPPFYLGGLGIFAAGIVEHHFSPRNSIFTRAQVGTATFFSTESRLLSFSLPASAVAGWYGEPHPGTNLRFEGGVWFPDAVCPSPVVEGCSMPWKRRVWPTLTPTLSNAPSVGAWAPRPVGLAQLDQRIGRRLMFTGRLIKDARLTQLYAYIDEKRIDGALTAQLSPAWQGRASTGLAWFSYGDPVLPMDSRAEFPSVAGFSTARTFRNLGRQDLLYSIDGSLRWTVTPWMVLSVQENVLVLLTTLKTRDVDGNWYNPGLVRSVTAGSVLLQW